MQTLDFTQPSPQPPSAGANPSAIEPGVICTHRRNAGGRYDTTFPYWQVRGRIADPTRRLWLCCAVPASVYPDQHNVWDEADLIPTGRSAPVITHHDLHMCMQREWNMNAFIAGLNFQKDGTHFTFDRRVARIARTIRRDPTSKGFYVTLPLLSIEADLIGVLGDLPWRFGTYPHARYTTLETA